MLDKIVDWAIPFICGNAISLLSMYFLCVRKLCDGMQCMLRDMILRNYKEYSRKGYCPYYAKEAENRAYKVYHALGGNDIATDKHEHIISLPDEPKKRSE